MDFRTLRLQLEGPIARLTLARPADSNRIDARLLRELAAACETIANQDAICITLLTAEGPNFCAGWDPAIFLSASNDAPPSDPGLSSSTAPLRNRRGARPSGKDGGEVDPARHHQNPDPLPLDPFGPITALPAPVIAVTRGATLSAGLELALACDVRIAADDARFGLPEVGQGTLPFAGGSQRLPRLVGRSVATSMLLLGDELDAEAAYRAGLVSRVVPGARLAAEAEAIAQRITAHGPLALRYAKEAIHHGAELSLDQALRYELDLSVILQTTHDRAEGVRAFLEKRPPNFEGR